MTDLSQGFLNGGFDAFCSLIEAGFEYVTEFEGSKIFRRRNPKSVQDQALLDSLKEESVYSLRRMLLLTKVLQRLGGLFRKVPKANRGFVHSLLFAVFLSLILYTIK